MAQASIHTELNNLQFVPGETVRGNVSWQPDPKITAVELRLFHYTAGKGTRDVELIDSQSWPSPEVGGGAFAFQLPEGPYSFSGRLVSLIWALELVLQPGVFTERLEITVSPTAKVIDLNRYPVPSDLDDEHAAKKWLRSKMQRREGAQR